MLLVIDDGKVSAEFEADIKRLTGNASISGFLANEERCTSLAALRTPLVTALQPGEPIIVLAHSDYRSANGGNVPWVAGRDFPDFASDLIAKFTAVQLSGRALYFITCYTGLSVRALANDLAAAGVRNSSLYLPSGLAFVSKNGILHVIAGYAAGKEANEKAANTDIARYDAEYGPLMAHAKATGEDVAGAAIAADGTTATIDADEAQDAVKGFFDPDDEEG
jgi:hypothetical protein